MSKKTLTEPFDAVNHVLQKIAPLIPAIAGRLGVQKLTAGQVRPEMFLIQPPDSADQYDIDELLATAERELKR